MAVFQGIYQPKNRQNLYKPSRQVFCMRITMVGFLSNVKRADLEKKLASSDIVDDTDIENLDKVDGMKDVTVVFKERLTRVSSEKTMMDLLGSVEKKMAAEDEE